MVHHSENIKFNGYSDAIVKVDSVLTSIAQDCYTSPDSVVNFIAPVIEVPVRCGRVIRFGKENFATQAYEKNYGKDVNYAQSKPESIPYTLQRYSENFRIPYVNDILQKINKTYEEGVIQQVTNPYNYEPSQGETIKLGYSTYEEFDKAAKRANLVSYSRSWDDPDANPISDICVLQHAMLLHVGIKPNSMVIGSKVFKAMQSNSMVIQKIGKSVDLNDLANYFELTRGVRVAKEQKLSVTNELISVFPENAVLLFYSPCPATQSIMPSEKVKLTTPSFAYTYQMQGTPFVEQQSPASAKAKLVLERMCAITGVGVTDKYGAGCLIRDVFV